MKLKIQIIRGTINQSKIFIHDDDVKYKFNKILVKIFISYLHEMQQDNRLKSSLKISTDLHNLLV